MTTTRFAATVYSCSPNIIVLRMPAPYIPDDFYLYQISLCLNTGVAGFVGCWQPGNPTHGGSRSVDVDQADFSRLYAECVGTTAVAVTLTYHDGGNSGYCIDNIDCAPITQTASSFAQSNVHRDADGPSVATLAATTALALLFGIRVRKQLAGRSLDI